MFISTHGALLYILCLAQYKTPWIGNLRTFQYEKVSYTKKMPGIFDLLQTIFICCEVMIFVL